MNIQISIHSIRLLCRFQRINFKLYLTITSYDILLIMKFIHFCPKRSYNIIQAIKVYLISHAVIPDKASKDGNSRHLWTPVESVAQDIHKFSQIVDVVMTFPSTVDTRQYLYGKATQTITQARKPMKKANASTTASIMFNPGKYVVSSQCGFQTINNQALSVPFMGFIARALQMHLKSFSAHFDIYVTFRSVYQRINDVQKYI